MKIKSMRPTICTLTASLVIGLAAQPALAAIELGNGWRLQGWARQYLSFNLEDISETQEDDKYDLSMNRQSLFFDITGPTGPLRWTGRFRFSHEFITDYEDRLEDLTATIPGNHADFKDEYNETDIRELFFDWQVSNRLALRIGRQQVVWGETDFFHATDVIHGFDLRWRKFLVPENEDVRKPLILLNGTFNVPEWDGQLQVVVRPGLDKEEWIGNSIPAFGGRWSNSSSKGFNFVSEEQGGVATYNYGHSEGDTDDAHYGFRWSGIAVIGNEEINYAFNYYHGQGGFYTDPTVTLDFTETANGNPLQFIFPETDTVGGSLSGYIPAIDAVYRLEVAYTPDRPMSTTNLMPVAALGGALQPFQLVEKDTWNLVVGLDTNLRIQNLIGTSNASLLSLQLFDWYIPGVDESDGLVRFDGSGVFDKHNTIATMILSNPFMSDKLNFTVVFLADLTEGGGMFIPSLQYDYGAHWRFKVEADLAFGGDKTDINVGFPPDTGSVFGALRDDDQFLFRITYQF
ncbi:MAG: LysR family transcriptional regulator [Pseudomonadales bacterium]|nr:hypothetical protein [Pseudomonadales bacterium]MCP5215826.1 LysR family transcriptional regulator [Pseudomonadales bacterium]